MGNFKIAGPVTCIEHGACKQTKLVCCYNIRKIQTTAINKKWLISGREHPRGTPPPPLQWFPQPLHAWKTVTQRRFKSSTNARIWRNYNIEQLLKYWEKPLLGKIQSRSVAVICGKSIQGKHNIHYNTTTRMKGKHTLQFLKLQYRHI